MVYFLLFFSLLAPNLYSESSIALPETLYLQNVYLVEGQDTIAHSVNRYKLYEKDFDFVIDSLSQNFIKQGHEFINLSFIDYKLKDNIVDLYFRVTAGERIQVDDIIVTDNRFSINFIREILELDSTFYISDSCINNFRCKLSFHNLVIKEYKILVSEEKDSPQNHILELDLDYKNPGQNRNIINGSIGYSQNKPLFGYMGITMNNLLKRTDRESFYYENNNKETSEIDLYYPRIFSLPINTQGHATIEREEDEYSFYRAFGRIYYTIITNESLGKLDFFFLFGMSEHKYASDEKGEQTIESGVGFSAEKKTETLLYKLGHSINFEASNLGIKDISNEKSESIKLSIDSDYSMEISNSPDVFYMMSMRYREIFSKGKLNNANLFTLGGFNSIRGYPADWFKGNCVVEVQNDIAFYISQYFSPFIFLDWGYYRNDFEDRENHLIFSVGMGLNAISGNNLISLHYANYYESEKRTFQSFGKGKIEVGILRYF